VYAERRRALLNDDLTPLMIEYAEKTCDDILEVRRGGAAGGEGVLPGRACWLGRGAGLQGVLAWKGC
jgi:hypothetical protein